MDCFKKTDDLIQPSGQHKIRWLCKCDCGNIKKVDTYSLTHSKSISCGCHRIETTQERCTLDLVGKRFGRLTVLEKSKNKYFKGKTPILKWKCICDCQKDLDNPKFIDVATNLLTRGTTRSCGCLKRDLLKERQKKYNNYDLSGEYGIGWTSNTNEEFYFDLEDYDKIKEYCWNKASNNYITTAGGLLLHRLIKEAKTFEVVDHISHNLFDVRKQNLRIGTSSNNGMNKRLMPNNTSGVTGVCWQKNTNMWSAEIGFYGNKIKLGRFTDFQEAVKARKEAEEKYFGEWSYDNSMQLNSRKENNKMNTKFNVDLNEINDVKTFLRVTQMYDCDINMKNGQLDAKSLMGMFSLDLSRPVDIEIITNNEDVIKSFADDIKDFIIK